MRVLLATTFFRTGQSEHAVNLARGLARRGLRVAVAATSAPEPAALCEYAARLVRGGVRVYAAAGAPRLLALLRRLRPHLLHAHSSLAWPVAARAAARQATPLVLTCHGSGLSAPAFRPALAQARAVVAVGEPFAAEVRPWTRAPVEVIVNGVDLRRFQPGTGRADGLLRVSLHGRVDRSLLPAFRAAVEAAGRLYARGYPVRLQVLGNWRPRRPWVIPLGWQRDPAQALRRSQVALACGMALREALAAGNACLLLGVGYGGVVWPATLRDHPPTDLGGRRGCPRPPRAGEIAGDLEMLAADGRLLHALRGASRRAAERLFDLERMLDRTLRVYRSILTRTARPA